MIEKYSVPKFLNVNVAIIAVSQVLKATFFDPSFPYLKRCEGHIVVLVPEITDKGVRPFVLYEHSIGENWPHQFDKIAMSKAFQLWEDRNDGGTDIKPHLLYTGDAPYWGGVKREGIVVACSGVQPYYDRMIAGMIADMCVALSYDAWEQSLDKKEDVDSLS